MIEYIIVIAIVAAAAYYTIRKLIGEAKGEPCANCSCGCGADKSKPTKMAKTIEKINKP